MQATVLAIITGALALTSQAGFAQTRAGGTAIHTPITLVFSREGPNGMTDLPMGVHRIPDSNVIISGHQKGGAIGVLFGPIGMLVQSTANAEGGTGKIRNVEDDLHFDAAAKAEELTAGLIADEKYLPFFTLSPKGGSTMTVTPYVLITFVNEAEARPYIIIKTKLDTNGTEENPKTVKYFCCEGKPMPLSGAGGLTENSGAALKALLASELEIAVQVMLQDRSQPYLRDKQKRVSVRGFLPFVGKPLTFKGYDLGRHREYSLIGFPGGGLVFGGVNIAEPGSLEIESLPAK
jgi:hypothetical protein